MNKVADFIYKERIQRLKIDPTNKYQVNIKKYFKNTNALFNEFEKYKLTQMNPTIPRLYGLLKIHKPETPIRLVVAHVGCPSYKLTKTLNALILSYSSSASKHSLKNSYELTSKLEQFQLKPGYKLASLDVTNMFGNIPPVECVSLISKMLEQKSINPIIIDEILEGLKIVLDQNYFEFNNKFYR